MSTDYSSILSNKLDHLFNGAAIRNAPKELQEHIQAILDFRETLIRPEIHIAFFGAFKAGKSTLINAMLAESLLPSKTNRATGVITKIKHSTQRSARVFRKNLPVSTSESIDIADIGKYILLNTSEAKSKIPTCIESVEISLNLPLLKNNCVLIDTPGLMDSKELTEITYKELSKSDLALMVLAADKPISQVEQETIQRINKILKGNIAFIINRLDLIDEDEQPKEEVIEWIKSQLEKLEVGNTLIGKPCIHGVEARNTLDARQSGIQSLASSTDGFLEFELWLDKLLNSSDITRIVVSSRLAILGSLLSNVSKHIQVQFSAIQSEIKTLTRKEVDGFNQAKDRLKKIALEDRLKINNYRLQASQLDMNFTSDCVSQVIELINSDKEWLRSDKINSCFNLVAQRHAEIVNHGVDTINFQTKFQLPIFVINLNILNLDFMIPTDQLMKTGMWIGGGIGAIFGGGIGAIPGAGIGAAIGEIISGINFNQKVLDAVEESARSLLPKLKSELENYLDNIDRSLTSQLDKDITTPFEPSLKLQEMQRVEKYYNSLITWNKQFEYAIEESKGLVERTLSQFPR